MNSLNIVESDFHCKLREFKNVRPHEISLFEKMGRPRPGIHALPIDLITRGITRDSKNHQDFIYGLHRSHIKAKKCTKF